jgi:hypothetical protein
MKIKDFKTAYSDLQKFKGMITMKGDVKTANIKKVELLYWEDSSPNSSQTYIQPVYKFSGDTFNEKGDKDNFVAYVQAIPDDITTPVTNNSPVPESTPKLPKSN